MANVLITRLCNRNCSYCFARGQFVVSSSSYESKAAVHMSLDHARQAARFITGSKLPVAGLMGGEPTLHPAFPEIVDLFLAHKLNIRLFTGGLIPPKVIAFLKGIHPDRIGINLNVPSANEKLADAQHRRIQTTLRELNTFISLAYTLCDTEEDLRFLVDMAQHYSTRRRIRLGLGVPSLQAITPPTLDPIHYRAAAPRVLELSEECQKYNITLFFDCGFPRCMFTENEISLMHDRSVRMYFACSPVVDIGVDLTVWSCFPLMSFSQARMQDFSNRDEIRRHFWTQQRAYRNLGVYEACLSCEHKRSGTCSGGCLSHVIRSFQ